MASNPKELRWNLRVEGSEDALVRAASKAADTSYSNFIRGAALAEAHRVLTDRDRFSLPRERWEQFTQLLEQAPRVPEGLRRLYSKPSVFE
jgi:uncharacterized protein (DUF1778 family)